MAEPVIMKMQNEVAVLTLNRPESYNALNLDMAEGLAANLIKIAANKGVRGVVITGEGKAFCSGGDLKWMLSYPGAPSAALHELAGRFHVAVVEVRRMSKPVIAAVNGVAAGAGFSIALACDFRVTAKSAIMKQAYTSSGLSIDGGGSFVLPRLVGMSRAMEILAFDKPISADQALAWGLTTRVAEDGKSLEEALNMAHELAKISMNSFGWSKDLVTNSFDSSFETHIERERTGIASCAAHPDGMEGIKAFVEKRKPVFWNDKT